MTEFFKIVLLLEDGNMKKTVLLLVSTGGATGEIRFTAVPAITDK